MGKKHYFFNSIYLVICIIFVAIASILNFNSSVAKKGTESVNGIYSFEEEYEEVEDQSYDFRDKPGEKQDYSIATSYKSSYKTARQANASSDVSSTSISYSSYIDIAGRVLRIEDVNDTLIDSTDHVNRWGKKFLYGHNTSSVFGPIRNLSEGDTFTVLMDGEEHVYRIGYTETMEKSKVEDNMVAIAYAKYTGKYDLSLMTCAGKSLGGGDATHRFVVLAKKIS